MSRGKGKPPEGAERKGKMTMTVIMRGDFLGKQRIEDSLQILDYPSASFYNIIDAIRDKVNDELPDGVVWNPWESTIVGEYGKEYDLKEDEVKELIEAKSMEVRSETEELQGLKMTVYHGYKIDDEDMGSIATYMDDEIRDTLHIRLAPCSHEEFLEAYLKEDPELLPILKNKFEFEWETGD